MTEPDWLKDDREIVEVKLAANGSRYRSTGGAEFERFERPGVFCMIPWIRVTLQRRQVIEAPLNHVELIEYRA